MLKKVLLTIAVIIFAVSCSSPSNPDKENTGDRIDSTYVGTWKGNSSGEVPFEYVAIVNSDGSIKLNGRDIPTSQITKNGDVYTMTYSLINESGVQIDVITTITFNSDGETANLKEVQKVDGVEAGDPLEITLNRQQ